MSGKKIITGIIGKAGHAARLISIVQGIKGVDLTYIYYPKSKENDFKKLLESDAIIIASPTYTHFDYFKKLRNYKGYIFLEKPAVSTKKETGALKRIPNSLKKRIKVNYNFNHSKTAQILKTLIKSQEIGKVIALNVWTSHGLAFKKEYQGSWRSDLKYSFGVLEMVGVHYINLALYLFGQIKSFNACGQWIAKKAKNLPPDTGFLNLEMKNGIQVNLYHSYAGPFFNKILLIGTNGYFDYDGQTAHLYSPRESYDKQGRFTFPKIKKTYQLDYAQIWKKSLEDSVKDFFEIVKNKKEFSLNDFEKALISMEPIFALKTIIDGNIDL